MWQWNAVEGRLPSREEDDGKNFLCYVSSNIVVLRFNRREGAFYSESNALIATDWMELCPPGD